LTITTSGHAFTGSATIGSTTKLAPSHSKCKAGGTKHTSTSTSYEGTWTGTKFAAHFSALGTKMAPATGEASFTTVTY
jgi:hypothetical protein